MVSCYYCETISVRDGCYPARQATFDLSSPAPRCALHWRYVCGVCGRPAHFMATAFCPQRGRYYCDSCATATDTVDEPFAAWDYFFRYRSPWTGDWQPSLDRLDFEGCHPARVAADAGAPISGLAEEIVVPRYPDVPQQWRCADPIDTEDVSAAWNRNAERWDAGYDHDGDETRRYFSDESLFRMLGDVTSRDVLDLGCGNGYLCRKLARAGAWATGVDLSDRMLANAEGYERVDPQGIRYLWSSIADLSALYDESFDRVVSNYVLQDLPEYAKALHEAYRVLRPGGHFVLVITHPCFTCGPRKWVTRASDSPRPEESTAFAVDHYFREDVYLLDAWEGFTPVPFFHRPLRDYWRTFRATGFDVDDFDEPSLNDRGRAELPAWKAAQADRIPVACVFRLSKPERTAGPTVSTRSSTRDRPRAFR